MAPIPDNEKKRTTAVAATASKRAKNSTTAAPHRVSTGGTPAQQDPMRASQKPAAVKRKSTKQQRTLDSFFGQKAAKKSSANNNNENSTVNGASLPAAPSLTGDKRRVSSAASMPPPSKKKSKTTSSQNSLTYLKTPYTAGDHLPIITEPQHMFDDMIRQKVLRSPRERELLAGLVQTLRNRPLRVATMCSGTESPLLALDMLQKSIQDACRDHPDLLGTTDATDLSNIFQLEHVFSCEIEPFKQAYLERNFHPPLLFRDIRELGNEKAYTAYGALVPVPNTPGCVDILIAGTSCVDYSNLNNRKKLMAEGGESGSTFFGMLKWIEKAKPPIVILENVYGAPWDQKVQLFEELGYAATYLKLDTKDYYIPHTRQRGYLFAIRQKPSQIPGRKRVDGRPPHWKQLVSKLQRPASAPLDAYLLSNNDPRVLRGRARLTAESLSDSSSRAARTDWTKCETRHLAARSNEQLGDQRPLTNWSESGKTALPGFFWCEWFDGQVNRIHDLADINTLRLATDGIDHTYKTMVWNLSQNVDRDTMGRLALTQCLTPTGVPYVTNRGGPMVGEELLMLQGIPADDLLFTKETEDNLKDLAGNAMSTTIVGACALCALLVGHKALPDREAGDSSNAAAIVRSLVPRALLPVSKDITVQQEGFGEYEQCVVDLSPKPLPNEAAWKELLAEAASSARKCVSEGVDECLPFESLVECQECSQTTAVSNADPPRKFEEHEFAAMVGGTSCRAKPCAFRKKLLDFLPMRVTLDGFDMENSLERPSSTDEGFWRKWIAAFRGTVATAEGDALEFQLRDVVRTHIWTAVYRSSAGGRLEARISKAGVSWLLFAKARTKKSALKDVLDRPMARMTVALLPSSSDGSMTLLDGTWEYCLPVCSAVDLSIQGVGETVPSWRAKLGLKGVFELEMQYSTLRIAVESSSATDGGLKKQIDGDYKLLPKCGGACGSLMKKVNALDDDDMFFFLESGRKTLPKHDTYVFASTCHRTAYGEYREIVMKIDPELEYRPLLLGDDSSSNESYHVKVRAIIPIKSAPAASGKLKPFNDNNASKMIVSRPVASLTVPMRRDSWKTCPELLSCTVHVKPSEDLFVKCSKAGGLVELNLQKSKKTLSALAFATSRLEIPALFRNDRWLELKLDRGMGLTTDDQELCCPKCAPVKPQVRWSLVSKGNKAVFVPIEDGVEAAVYERALKDRPQPWIVRLAVVKGESLSLTVSCNAFSLSQQAFSLLPSDSIARQYMIGVAQSTTAKAASVDGSCLCGFDWRVVPHEEMVAGDFAKLMFSSNRLDQEAQQPPNFSQYPLRKEQLRSLTWMLDQESTTKPFFEEEVAEAILPSFSFRAEARARRPVLVRGGIIADEVGYGKTAITLGLIDSAGAMPTAPEDPPAILKDGFISTKATLVVVPKHLMGQWPAEIKKFLGTTKELVVIKDLSSLNNLSIEDIENADIVLCSFALLSNEKYFTRLARLSGRNPGSFPSGSSGGRHFTAVYHECLDSLAGRISQIQSDCPSAYLSIEEAAAELGNGQAEGSLRLDGKKAVYKMGVSASHAATSKFKIAASDCDPWGLRNKDVQKVYSKMKSPPLEMFLWNRVVVDEFTYLGKSERDRCLAVIQELKSKFRWLLSGTPPHSDFNDISSLSSLLGVHLGVDEELPGTKLKKFLSDKESTGLESLSSFLESRSMQWHMRRHALGQHFLDRFVRQNVAEIDEILYEEHDCLVELPAAERAIYMELDCYLQSLDMNSKSGQKSKRKSTGDRESRMQKVIRESQSGEEALLKCCSHFNLSSGSSTNALDTVDTIISLRQSEKMKLEKEAVLWLTAAFRQRQRISDCQPGWIKVTTSGKGELLDALGIYLDQVDAGASVPHGADKQVNLRIQELVEEATAVFDANPRPMEPDAFFPDKMDCEDEKGGGDSQDGNQKKKKKKGSGKGAKEISPVALFAMKHALRNHMHGVRSLAKELCGRVRSLRYIQHIRRYQQNKESFSCSCCKKKELNVANVGVLSCCGHSGCLSCLRTAADEGRCIVADCSARASLSHVVSANNFTSKTQASTGRFGQKLSAVTKKVKEIVSTGDRVIVFCQFDDLSEKVKESLSHSGIKSVEVKGTVTQQISTISVFQKDDPAKDDPRVLLLKLDDEQSAGLNLTNLNHAVFVHPLLADSQQEYDAYETQAIGRIRRYGQKKTVHVWRFLAKDTIDTKIFAQRSNREIPSPEQTD